MQAISSVQQSIDSFLKQRSGQTLVNAECEIEGIMTLNGPANIAGKVNGTITAKGLLVIDETAMIDANIMGDSIVICGTVRGNITATKNVIFSETAVVTGEVITPLVEMQTGARFEGSCQMPRGLSEADPAIDLPVDSPVHSMVQELDAKLRTDVDAQSA